MNSYDDLSFIAGLGRDGARGGIGGFDLGVGYRVGFCVYRALAFEMSFGY